MKYKQDVPSLSIVIPCYNESEIFSYCLSSLSSLLNELISRDKICKTSKIIFIDDGSKDDTWNLINLAVKENNFVSGVKLSRNKGHQTALMAGLSVVTTDISISIDADLQDDISCIPQMIDEYLNGADIVYGVRSDRSTDVFFKRLTANTFYKFMSKLGVEQIENHADFRLLSRRALEALLKYEEQNLYIRGIIPQLGYKSTKVYYSRSERTAGESKYPLKKMLSLAIDGVTSLSVTPLRLVSLLGFSISLISFLMIIYSLFSYFSGNTVSGWASVIIALSFLGGVQMLCLGVIGEYVGKIYLESKKRPKFFIEKHIE